MDYNYERKLEINEWVINSRWFYMVAVFLIGILGNSLVSLFEYTFSFFYIAALLLLFLVANSILLLNLKNIKKNKSEHKLRILGFWQIAIELLVFTVITYLLGEKSMASLFFFIPIISASILFGVRGSVITALLSGFLVNIFAVFEYFNMIFGYLFDRQFLSTFSSYEVRYSTLNLIKTIVASNLYLVIAIISGYGSKYFFKREQVLFENSTRTIQEKDDRLKQLEKSAQYTEQVKKHDEIITSINKQLGEKINELENSEKSMLRAFSDLKLARESTEKEQRKTSAIISNFVDPIILIDKNDALSLFNPAAQNVFGFLSNDLGKKVSPENNYSLSNFKGIVDREFSVKSAKELKSGNPFEEEAVINLGGQENTYKVITAGVVDKNNENLGIMKIFYNLTREKMIDKMKSEFISIAAHQLRTPLSAIKWAIKMILDGDVGKLNEEQAKLLFKGYESNERIIILVNDMLNVSRIEEGRFGYNFKKEDFVKAVELQIDALDSIIKQKNIKLEFTAPKKLPLVYMDGGKMALVIQNLLENAVKYTPEYGKIFVKIEAGGNFLKVKVKDNGVGIPEKDQAKLFSKFFRAENAVRLQTEGSGLGLFIVKNIIKKHGGEISFESEEGKGTEFVFTIPFDEFLDEQQTETV
jgi:signal transduction histidine kinase